MDPLFLLELIRLLPPIKGIQKHDWGKRDKNMYVFHVHLRDPSKRPKELAPLLPSNVKLHCMGLMESVVGTMPTTLLAPKQPREPRRQAFPEVRAIWTWAAFGSGVWLAASKQVGLRRELWLRGLQPIYRVVGERDFSPCLRLREGFMWQPDETSWEMLRALMVREEESCLYQDSIQIAMTEYSEAYLLQAT
jgi:hypothetical protein